MLIFACLDVIRLLEARTRGALLGSFTPRTRADICFVLMSGGIDSTVALFLALKLYKKVYAIELEYKDRPLVERKKVLKILSKAGVESFYIRYPKVVNKTMTKGKYYLSESNALYYLAVTNFAQRFTKTKKVAAVDIWAGQVLSDWFNFKKFLDGGFIQYVPEASPSFYKLLNKLVIAKTPHKLVSILTPFIYLKKDEVVKIGVQVDAPLKETWSCPRNSKVPCSRCQQCLERDQVFRKFNII